MFEFIKKKNNGSPPDIGKEEEIEYKENINEYNEVDGNVDNIADKPYEKIPDRRANFEDKMVNGILQSSQLSISQEKTNFDIEKIKAKLELTNSLITAFNERFSRINQQVGEIRAMSIANEKNLSISNLDAKKTVDIVKEVNPEKLRLDYQKADLKLSTLVEKMESYKQYMDSIMEELKDLKRRANLFEGTDALLRLNEEVKKDLIQIQKINARVRMNADKSEQVFIELSKGFQENQKLNETVMNLDNSYSGLKKEIEKLNLDYGQILNIEDFNDFKKKVSGRFKIIENFLSDVEKMKEENQKTSRLTQRILLMEKRNEEDIATLAFKSGNNRIGRVSDYEQKLFSILEVIEKMAHEIKEIKSKIGIQVLNPADEQVIPENEISEESMNFANGVKGLKTMNAGKINNLLSDGKNYLMVGDLTMAWKMYKDISNLYNPLEDNNRAIYSQIINFYDALSHNANKPVVTSSTEKETPAEFPAMENRKYKKLGDY